MKIVRLGHTESHLLFFFFILKFGQEHININKLCKKNINYYTSWLHKTAGYYEKSTDTTIINKNYNDFIDHLGISIGNCEVSQFYLSEMVTAIFEKHKKLFFDVYKITNFQILNETHFSDRIDSIFAYIKDKKVLVVSSFDGLILKQYQSRNIYKIYKNFPELIDLKTIKFPYCYNNNGPHNNYHETLDSVFNDIKDIDFDIALLGCGCYGHMLCHKIHSELNKDAIYLGGSIQEFFGILSSREKSSGLKYDDNWITEIPEEYRPDCFKNIENGCYW